MFEREEEEEEASCGGKSDDDGDGCGVCLEYENGERENICVCCWFMGRVENGLEGDLLL